ncbi:hypothetical protein MKW94_009880, partial [Papaver nudicaule]|nr:hypothetical protein [Papaver nudicaule]
VGGTSIPRDPLSEFYEDASVLIEQAAEDVQVPMDAAIFNSKTSNPLYLSLDDIFYICHEEKEASINNVAFYIRYLHEKIISLKKERMFGFINPATFALNSRTPETLLNELKTCLANVKTEYVFLSIPKIWWLCSVNGKPIDNIDEIMKSAVENCVGERPPSWYSPPHVPRQPGYWECGFYVMRFMKDIIEGKPNPVTGLMRFEKQVYDKDDIMEVKMEWMNHLKKHLMCVFRFYYTIKLMLFW